MTTLKLVLTDKWFEEIKSGRKTHEYRLAKPFWIKRICMGDITLEDIISNQNEFGYGFMWIYTKVEFQKAYRKNAERMTFRIKDIQVINGKDTDLKVDEYVFDIELGNRVDEIS